MVRTFCAHCYMALIDASPNTADCRLGELCGCGARFCGIKCLVADAQAHKAVCANVQLAMQFFAKSRFRATEKTNQLALKWGGQVQMELLRADMFVAASGTVNALLFVANSLCYTGAFELAQKFAQRALPLAAKGSLDEANVLFTLGNVASDLSKYDAAVAHFEAALKIEKSLHGDDHVAVAGLHVNLSALFQRLGRLDEALAMCSSALEIFNKAPSDNQHSIAMCHNSMGNVLNAQAMYEEAMEHYSSGLAITLKTEGETALAANFLNNIGNVLAEQGKLDEAMEKHVSALRIYEKAKMDTSVALCHFNIGNSLKEQGKLDAALEHARKSLEIRKSKLSIEHAERADSHCLIGDILMHSGKFAEALDEYENALRIRKNVFGEMTLKVAHVYGRLAKVYKGLRKWREAVTFYEATIHIRNVLIGADDGELWDDLTEVQDELEAERSASEQDSLS